MPMVLVSVNDEEEEKEEERDGDEVKEEEPRLTDANGKMMKNDGMDEEEEEDAASSLPLIESCAIILSFVLVVFNFVVNDPEIRPLARASERAEQIDKNSRQ